jgi:citrate lyase subunit beta/citryl-CoA lyase
MTTVRPLRSWMFVPGNSQRFLDKSFEVAADAVFLDLEDGVPPPEKTAARELVAGALRRPAGKALRFVRLNAPESPWLEDDLKHVLVPGLDGVCLPKVETPGAVAELARRLDRFEAEHGLEPRATRVVAAIESAAGLLAAPAIAGAHPRVLALMFGAEDFGLDIGLGTLREGEAGELLHARSAIVVAAAAARVGAIDGVWPDLTDHDGLVGDAVQARRLGFTGKSTFNPRQLDLINRLFSPSTDEIAYARRVAEAFEAAQARGEGSVAVGGQLVDRPIVRRAQRLLETLDVLEG